MGLRMHDLSSQMHQTWFNKPGFQLYVLTIHTRNIFIMN